MFISKVRTKLLEELFSFVCEAIKISGISRIALIGSLCTNKPNPKDVDVLITIDDIDLTQLALITRRLNGHVQQFNHNADVFLADPNEKYLGRVCLWKDCRPGVRMRCDALNCGARKYLHDDLKTITLRKELIQEPPIEFWPEIVLRVKPPIDVQEILIDPLKKQDH